MTMTSTQSDLADRPAERHVGGAPYMCGGAASDARRQPESDLLRLTKQGSGRWLMDNIRFLLASQDFRDAARREDNGVILRMVRQGRGLT